MLDGPEEPSEVLDLGEEKKACVGGQETGYAFRGRMRAVGRAERIVDE